MPTTDKGKILRTAILAASFCVLSAAFYFGPLQQPTSLDILFVSSVMLGLLFFIFFMTVRPAFAMMATGILFSLITIIARLKETYLGNAFLISDIYYMTGTHIIATIWKYPALRLAMVCAPMVSASLLWLSWKYSRTWTGRPALAKRGVMRLVGSGTSLALLAWLLMPSGPFSSLYDKSMWAAINKQAHLTSFLMSINAMRVQLPNVHNTPQQNAEWDQIASHKSASDKGGRRPDILIVLEESTFDPSTLEICRIPQCENHKLFQANKWTKVIGPMISHVYGGGTALSEHDVIAGVPFGVFGLAGGYAPWSLAPRMRDSLPMQLSRLGYENIAVYTVDGGYMNARQAYKLYGFDQFYDATTLHLKPWGSTDAEMFAAAMRVYERARKETDKPIFMMLKTIEQHGPHNNHPLQNLPPPYDKGLFPNQPPDVQLNLSNYLARLDASDRAMEELEKLFLDRPEPTIVLSFGDHKPNFSGVMDELKIRPPDGYSGDPKYITYFKLDANFQTVALPSYPATDIAYLPEYVLSAADLPRDEFFNSTRYLMQKCNGLFGACTDKQVLYSYYAWLFSDEKVFE